MEETGYGYGRGGREMRMASERTDTNEQECCPVCNQNVTFSREDIERANGKTGVPSDCGQ